MRRMAAVAGLAALILSGATPVAAHEASSAAYEAPSGAPLQTWHGDQAGERFGFAVSQLRDIDRDGVQEAVIGAPFHKEDGIVTGHVDVRSGRTGRLLFRFDGAPEDRLGYSMADAGDVNGDGVTDIVAGATGVTPLACVDVPRHGRVYVYSGRTGRRLLQVDGEVAGDQFGAAVGAAGDVDRDGRADIVVGAPCHDGPNGVDTGKAYVVSGRTGRVLRTHDGAQAGDGFGWGVAGLGDVTGDHQTDYIVGAKDAGEGDRGLAYVYDGRRGSVRYTLAGDARSMEFGWFFVATAGDVNGDRVEDIYVGDFCGDDDTGTCSTPLGQAYVFDGRTGRQLYLFRGVEPGDGAGPGRSAGDIDRDGRADIVVGLYASSSAAPLGGRIQVHSGRTGAVLFDYASPNANETLGYDAVGVGDVNHDGRGDLLVSGAVNDVVYVLSS
jgi:FG-GAP repeat